MNNKLIENRKNHISPNLSLLYDEPLHLVKSKGLYLYDINGNKYLDGIGNINIVGHCNEHVIKAVHSQLSLLNTNTRYLYDIMEKYSKKLLSYFPKELSVIYFVCSGSEANDLAKRIADNYTNGTEYLVIDNGYFGHTSSLINLSPYKFKGKGGIGKKNYVHILDMPDPIRGKWTYNENNWSQKYISDAINQIRKINQNTKISCLFVESILGCGGQIILPPNYLKQVFKEIKKNNGLCIVDEVQTGFGRIGNHFWSFQEHKVTPDIVTLGKPMGNGHPIAAVITTEKIASAFDNGMEYFNSFGGNPVSCAVGKAVLEVIEKEKLQKNALIVGNYFLKKLKNIKDKNRKYISEVRGRGLFLGIDIIKDYNYSKPNSKLAKKIVNYMRDNGILLSTDGPCNNVIKIKPPLVFNKKNVDTVCINLNNFFNKI